MDGLREQVLASAALARHEDVRGTARRHLPHQRGGLDDSLRVAHDGITGGLPVAVAPAMHLGAQAPGLEAVANRDPQGVEVERLREEVEQPDPERGDGVLQRAVGGHHDRDRAGIDRLDLPQDIEAGLIGQLQVEQRQVRHLRAVDFHGSVPVAGLDDVVAPGGELLLDGPALERLVFDDEDFFPGHR